VHASKTHLHRAYEKRLLAKWVVKTALLRGCLPSPSVAWNKSVVFAEIGYASFAGAAAQPWACCTGLPDLQARIRERQHKATLGLRLISRCMTVSCVQAQATLYSALYSAVWSQDFVAGIFPWAWSAGA
jgi:hypothetical protein